MHLCTQTVWEDIWKPTLEKSRSNATNATSDLFTQTIWEHIWNSQWRKVVQMQLCICSDSQFEKTFENSILRKIVQMQPTWLASVHSDDLRKHLKTHTGKSHWNATNATMHLFWQAMWEDIWKLTLEKNRSYATNATSHMFTQTIWENIWNSHWNKVIEMQPMRLCTRFGGQLEKKTHSGEKSFKFNQCDIASLHSDDLRKHLKTHTGKSHRNATNATMHLFWQVIWEDIWKLTL